VSLVNIFLLPPGSLTKGRFYLLRRVLGGIVHYLGVDIHNGFNEVDDDILERSERATVSNVVSIRRRWPVALIAAILCLFLMGAGVVAVIYGDSIQSWFGHYFGLVTGQEMSEGQTALIDHLSQDIGQSKGMNLEEGATAKDRNAQIGGHKA